MELLTEKDNHLTSESYAWSFEDTTLQYRTGIVEQMTDVMLKNKGMGLAAPQVGIMQNLFIMLLDGKVTSCFNPIICDISSEVTRDTEGCLSFPDLYINVTRAKSITCKYQDIDGDTVIKKLSDMEARCFQHELDHLSGICFTSKVSKMALQLGMKRRLKLRNNK